MTYCLAIKVNRGLIFGSDSRTNAGVDHVATYSKMRRYIWPGERACVLMTSGSLATSQAVIHAIERDLADPDAAFSLRHGKQLYEVAQYIGQLSQQEQQRHAKAMEQSNASAESNFILGGQIAGKETEIFHIYPQGNFISASEDTPYLQIGETKYGKPILDRIISKTTTLEDAARCAMVSLDSTIRSNISVGPPIEIAMYQKDSLEAPYHNTYTLNSPMYKSMQKQWTDGVRKAFDQLPRYDWEKN